MESPVQLDQLENQARKEFKDQREIKEWKDRPEFRVHKVILVRLEMTGAKAQQALKEILDR